MSDPRSIQPDPSMIAGVQKAPFVRLPDPATLFSRRAARLRTLAGNVSMAPYLDFLAVICDAQCAVLPALPDPLLPAREIVARARQLDLPPIDRTAFKPDAAIYGTCRRLFDELVAKDKPDAAEAALVRARKLDDLTLDRIIAAVLADSIPADALAEHIYAAAALQIHFARLASRMDGAALVPVGVGVCPVCGGGPVASLIVGWYGAEGARYASCMLCATLWNEVRVKCLVCGSTKGIGYQEIDGQDGTVKAETCDECGSYVKVLYHHKNVQLEPVADDVASLVLDQLLRESAYSRAGINPYLAGY
jgi:FdhE protein